jgi:hypothetical protein
MDLKIWRCAVERGGRGEKRETHGESRKQTKRVAAWLRERLPRETTVFDERNPSRCQNGEAAATLGRPAGLNPTGEKQTRGSMPVRSGS